MTDAAAAVLLLAKEPVAGRVKTRLGAAFAPHEAAALASAAIEDTLAAVGEARPARSVAVWEGTGPRWRQRLVAEGWEVVDQCPGSLGDRLAEAFACAAAGDLGGPRLLIGMDTPQVRPAQLAVDWEGADAVLGLSDDGGFWAIGLRDADPAACFAGIPMSTDRTGAAQLNRLIELGLSVKLLSPLRDIDQPADAEAVAYRYPWLAFSECYRAIVDRHTRQPANQLFDQAYTGAPLQVEGASGASLQIDVPRWAGPADVVDLLVVSRCEPPVLDLGCGPGRLVRALTESGRSALGVDMSAAAVGTSLRHGGPALRARLEDPLPAEGRWGTVLLIDGNVGIGGDVPALLERCRQLMVPGGLLLCEVDTASQRHENQQIVLRSGHRISHPLGWSRIGAAALTAVAATLDLWVAEEWSAGGRTFVALRRAR